MSEERETYSVMLRLQRITYEDAYVAVPVTESIMSKKEDGTLGIDADALVAEALRISEDERVEWQVESVEVMPHPTQGPKPDGRKSFDAFYA